jgi:hypothetical protein
MHGLKIRRAKIRGAAGHLKRAVTQNLLEMEHRTAAPNIVRRECVPEAMQCPTGGAKPSCSHSHLTLRRELMRRTSVPSRVAKSKPSGLSLKSAVKRYSTRRRAKLNGTIRCFPPFPSSVRSKFSMSTSRTRNPSASEIRQPQSSNNRARRCNRRRWKFFPGFQHTINLTWARST